MGIAPTHLTAKQLGERLHRSTVTLATWRGNGSGPKFIPGRPVLYPIIEVEKWEAARLVASTAAAT